ncbi:MAG TPA: alpha/beta hydrolase, partial [Thermoleophilia bacterium]|nr:alpha/beta hydrolase [Thermoleophilia bacterium]
GSYYTEKGDYKADVGTLVVPENRADRDSRLIALPVVRIRARSERPAEPIFRLEGGPGITNMEFANASRFADKHDVVLVGYRGVDGSSVLDAPEVESALKHSTDFLSEESMRSYAEAFSWAAKRFRAEGVDLAGYTLTQQVEDLEAARVALGYDRIDLLSESAGTRTAMIYAWRHPESIHRSVMIGVNPPGNYLWDPKTTDEQIGRYARLYSQDDASRDGTTGNLAASMRYTARHMPDRWLFLPIKEGNVRVASFMGMMESTTAATPFSAPMVLDAWLSAAQGDASGFWVTSLITDLMFPKIFVWGEYAAAGRIDAEAARKYFSSTGQDREMNLGRAASTFVWGGGRLADAFPADPDEERYSQVRTSNVEALLIGGELDLSTPPQIATRELLPYLPNGHQVVLDGIGHSGSFWTYQSEAGSRLINTYFDSGRVDDSLYRPGKVDFTPVLGFAQIAKIVAGTMVGIAILAALSLLWMVRRVHKRGGYGRQASAVLRSLYPFVLGLGGWFLGALVVMTTMPGVPLDNDVLAVLSVGVPVGLGIYWAWVHRDWSGATRTAGFVGALSGALLGGWLGFNATAGLLSLITTIVGATVGENLTLVVFDITRERSDRSHLAAASPQAAETRAAA